MALNVRAGWIFSPAGDCAVFAGPVALAFALVWAFPAAAAPGAPLPLWAYAGLIVACDVAHVWATAYRTVLDPEERARRPALLAGVPLACFVGGTLLHSASPAAFWRGLAYLAVFHFVRQQWGFMAYAGRKAGETSRLDRWFDRIAIDNATLFPLLHWHAHLPRDFEWFVPGDFVPGIPLAVADAAHVVHWAINVAYLGRQALHVVHGRPVNPAKLLILATTWAAWYGGIVWLASDLAFTATNVLAHGVPYLALVWRWGRGRYAAEPGWAGRLFRPRMAWAYAGSLILAAFLEEGLWDRFRWHEHGALFPGPALELGPGALAVVVALLAVPQATHYVLDGFLWRTGAANPGLADRLGLSAGPREP